jgi:hypothetical protein
LVLLVAVLAGTPPLQEAALSRESQFAKDEPAPTVNVFVVVVLLRKMSVPLAPSVFQSTTVAVV